MPIEFFKYHGAGNDFIMIDDREMMFPVSVNFINHLCDRRFGIGADGLILLRNHPEYDFEMVYFNSDGNLASMCGNGGRCTAAFAKYLGMGMSGTAPSSPSTPSTSSGSSGAGGNENFNFLAVDGPHKAFFKDGLVSLQIKDVAEISKRGLDVVLDTGSPHYVRFVDKDDIKGLDVVKLAKEIRYRPEFKEKGINVNFLSVDNAAPNHISIRTYERGVEDETLACGTGVVASAIAYFHGSNRRAAAERVEAGRPVAEPVEAKQHISVSALGGELEVDFEYDPKNHYTHIWLTGPAEMVFRGEIRNDQ